MEFSATKIVFNNNLEEFEDTDLEKLLEKLQEKLNQMGLSVEKEDLKNAEVNAVHFSKNLRLESGYTSQGIISEINKVTIRTSFDMAKVKYDGGGESVCLHSNSHEFIIYDKIADLTKPKSRAIDKLKIEGEKDLKESFKGVEVLRLEARLNKPKKKKETLKKFGIETQTLKNVFSKELSQKILIDYWDNEIKKYASGLLMIKQTPTNIFQTLKINGIKPRKAIFLTGLVFMARDKNLREIKSDFPGRKWSDLKKDLKIADDILSKGKIRNWVEQIDSGLNKFETFTIAMTKPP